jgi:alpha-ketoglutaric semialdehyde dehydrogenase
MQLHGKNVIACGNIESVSEKANASTSGTFTSRGNLGRFQEATEEDVNQAFDAAARAFRELRHISVERRAAFLDRVGDQIDALGEDLLTTANIETALPVAERLVAERRRTVLQWRLFAGVIREGSWVDARIDRASDERKPPKPDVRRMLVPLGPVAVFSASNFPLAFSVPGGDTASALAAGCPVVVKAHPAHPATSELIAGAISEAATATGMPAGIFSMLQSTRNELAVSVVEHRLSTAVAFTGSLRAGRLLFNVAAARPRPIPFYAEMGSVNPVFVLPRALKERADAIAQGMKTSVLLGVGQFCTCPGLTVGIGDQHFARFSESLAVQMRNAPPASMLYDGILKSYESGSKRLSEIAGVQTVSSVNQPDVGRTESRPATFMTTFETFTKHNELSEELFGPSTVVVRCNSRQEMLEVARSFEGQLTATIHGTPEDLAEYADLVSILEDKVGRLIFNGFPTGVEVCAAMQHGGPYPATTDSRTTSVGTAAILRFVRPVAYQGFPQPALPLELQDANPREIWRLVDGQLTREPLQ